MKKKVKARKIESNYEYRICKTFEALGLDYELGCRLGFVSKYC